MTDYFFLVIKDMFKSLSRSPSLSLSLSLSLSVSLSLSLSLCLSLSLSLNPAHSLSNWKDFQRATKQCNEGVAS